MKFAYGLVPDYVKIHVFFTGLRENTCIFRIGLCEKCAIHNLTKMNMRFMDFYIKFAAQLS